jgi:hypothetical protein
VSGRKEGTGRGAGLQREVIATEYLKLKDPTVSRRPVHLPRLPWLVGVVKEARSMQREVDGVDGGDD